MVGSFCFPFHKQLHFSVKIRRNCELHNRYNYFFQMTTNHVQPGTCILRHNITRLSKKFWEIYESCVTIRKLTIKAARAILGRRDH